MAVFRINKNENYTSMSNFHLQDKRLSLKSKGLLSVMLSLPDEWNYSIEGLAKINKESPKQIKPILEELKQYDYLFINKLMPNQTKTGRIEYIYDIYEQPKTRVPKQEGCLQEVENKRVVLGDNKILKENTKEENTKEVINTTTNTIFDLLQENGFNLTPIQYDLVSQWEDNDLTRYAIKKAVLNNKFNVSYIDKILYSYKKNNITTVEQAIQDDEDFENKRDFYFKKKYEVKETRREREERIMKEWLEKDE